MKKIVVLALLAVFSGAASAVWIEGYTRPDGVYVSGHWSDEPRDYAKEDRDYRARNEAKKQEEPRPYTYETPKTDVRREIMDEAMRR